MEKLNIPEIRFKGFSGKWEEKELGTVTDIVMGQSPSGSSYSLNPKEGLYVLIQGNADLKNRQAFPRIWTSQITRMANKDDIIMSVRAPAGAIGRTKYKAVIGRGVAAINGNEFIYQTLIKMEKGYWKNISTGSTFDSLDKKTINEAMISIPENEEQKQIGNFFKNLDEKLQIEKEKHKKLLDFKKAMLEDMFPKEGENIPRIRFDGFEEKWEAMELNEFLVKAVDNRGKTPLISQSGSYPLIEVISLGSSKPDYSKCTKFLDEKTFNNSLRGYVKEKDILFSTVGSVGLVSVMDDNKKAAIAQNIVAFRALNNFNPSFIHAMLSTHDNKIRTRRIVMGAVQPSIKVSQLIYVEYLLTKNIEEQTLIGNFFKNLDDKIEQSSQRIKKIENFKSAMMEKMFI